MPRRNELQQLLKKRNLKKTSQRALIWGVFLDSKGHPSVEDVRDRLIAKGHRIGIATVYRTIKLLLDSGFLRQSKLHGVTRYESLVGQPNHLHFECVRCGSNVEFPSQEIENLIQRVTRQFDFEERYSRYVVNGLCKACVRKEEKAAGISQRRRYEKTVLRDALELTLTIERHGYAFYTSASRKTKNDRGRLMFQRLAAEESDHIRRIQSEHHALMAENDWLKQEPARLPVSRKIAADIFPRKALLKIQVADSTTELEALRIAMDLEERSHRFFTDFSKQIDDPIGKRIFKEFARDEKSHMETLLAEYNALSERHEE